MYFILGAGRAQLMTKIHCKSPTELKASLLESKKPYNILSIQIFARLFSVVDRRCSFFDSVKIIGHLSNLIGFLASNRGLFCLVGLKYSKRVYVWRGTVNSGIEDLLVLKFFNFWNLERSFMRVFQSSIRDSLQFQNLRYVLISK